MAPQRAYRRPAKVAAAHLAQASLELLQRELLVAVAVDDAEFERQVAEGRAAARRQRTAHLPEAVRRREKVKSGIRREQA